VSRRLGMLAAPGTFGAALVAALLLTAACTAAPPVTAPAADLDLPARIAATAAESRPFVTGVVAGGGALSTQIDPPLVRVEFLIGATPDDIRPTVEAYAARGSRVLLLAGFPGTVPTLEEARNLGTWARAFGPASGAPLPVTAIEFGNETSYSDQYGDGPGDASYTARAVAYARMTAVAADAVRAADPGVGLLAQADDAGTKSPVWLTTVLSTEPGLDDRVVGWTLHPYGPTYDDRLARTRSLLTAHGARKPLWITEWGLASDGGRCLDDNFGWDPCMTEADAAATLLTVAADLPRYDVAAFLIYQARDQRPSGAETGRDRYFGILTNTGAPKGLYTRAATALWNRP